MDDLTKHVARQIIDRVGGPGQPPDYGFQYFSAGLGPYLGVIEAEYLDDFIREGGSSFKIVVGPYGGGKTHLLYSVRELAWKNNYVTSYIELRQNSTPLHKLELVYASVVQRVAVPQPPEEILTGQSHGIESLLRSALQRQRDSLRDAGVPAAEVDGEIRAWIAGFSRLDSVSFQKAIRAAFAALLADREDDFDSICQWLRGEGYLRAVHGKYGILQKIDKSTAFSMTRSLLQVVRDLGYEGLVVLMDEAEQGSSLNSKQRDTLLSNLRELIDEVGRSDFKHAMLFYAVPNETFLQGRGQVYQALVQRLSTTFDRINPTGVKIMLDDVWADPIPTLAEIGQKLARIYEVGYDCTLDPEHVTARAGELAEEAYEQRFGDVGYRRLFVQNMVSALSRMARNDHP
jgi:hypothetical protein